MGSTTENQARAVEFLQLAASGDVDTAFSRHVAQDFVHHNPWFASDRESLRVAMAESSRKEPNKSFQVQRAIGDGDVVAVHSKLEREGGGTRYAVVHILRFSSGRIVEMWDIGQEVPKESPNGLGMF